MGVRYRVRVARGVYAYGSAGDLFSLWSIVTLCAIGFGIFCIAGYFVLDTYQYYHDRVGWYLDHPDKAAKDHWHATDAEMDARFGGPHTELTSDGWKCGQWHCDGGIASAKDWYLAHPNDWRALDYLSQDEVNKARHDWYLNHPDDPIASQYSQAALDKAKQDEQDQQQLQAAAAANDSQRYQQIMDDRVRRQRQESEDGEARQKAPWMTERNPHPVQEPEQPAQQQQQVQQARDEHASLYHGH